MKTDTFVSRNVKKQLAGIFLQGFLNVGVFATLATDNVGANRFQVSRASAHRGNGGSDDFVPFAHSSRSSLPSRW